MLQRTGEAETITTHYLFALGLYRALYIPNWIYRYFTEGWFHPVPIIAGILQTLLYSDFFYIYYTKYVAAVSPWVGRIITANVGLVVQGPAGEKVHLARVIIMLSRFVDVALVVCPSLSLLLPDGVMMMRGRVNQKSCIFDLPLDAAPEGDSVTLCIANETHLMNQINLMSHDRQAYGSILVRTASVYEIPCRFS